MAPEQEASLAPSCWDLGLSEANVGYCVEERTCDIVKTFGAPSNHSTPP